MRNASGQFRENGTGFGVKRIRYGGRNVSSTIQVVIKDCNIQSSHIFNTSVLKKIEKTWWMCQKNI